MNSLTDNSNLQQFKEKLEIEAEWDFKKAQSVLFEKAQSVLKDKKSEIDNLYLLHHRYFSMVFVKNKEKPHSLLHSLKLKNPDLKIGKSDFKPDKRLTDRTAELVKENYPDYLHVEYEPLDKLAIGIGGGSPYDTLLLMTLHHLYGLPYLPATAIKGMLSHYCRNEIEEIDGDLHETLFGTADKQGQLIFFDIFPTEYELDFDVMTPHYAKYYRGESEPTDDLSPDIITFPCVKGAKFDVYVAWSDKECFGKNGSKLKGILEEAFQEAFRFYGIGAKTALGYGLGK